MRRRFGMLLAAGLALGWGAAFGGGAADQVSLSDPYARAAAPGQPNGVVYLGLANVSDQAHSLVGAESDAAETVELHDHLMEGGMMKMRRVQRIELPPGSALSLEPGGLHLMLIGLKRQLEPDQRIGLTLIFEDGTRTHASVPVRQVEARMGAEKQEGKCGAGRCGTGRCGGGK